MHFQALSMPADNPLSTLSTDFLNLFNEDATFSDVIFLIEGRQVHAHRCILMARSKFFRMLFCKADNVDGIPVTAARPYHIPVDVMGHDVFMVVLQFLYGGQLVMVPDQASRKCPDIRCSHKYCASLVDLALDTFHAASFFGVEQLSSMTEKHLAGIVDKMAIEDCMRVLITAKRQGLLHLWNVCLEFVAHSGLTTDALNKYLQRDMVIEIEEIRAQKGMKSGELSSATAAFGYENRIRRMRLALDAFDLELVRLMVMGEGLDLDKAQALHYAVTNCSRNVVKALLEMSVVDVDCPGHSGKTALHLASEMGSPDMISVLLDHHASPLVRSDDGYMPVDIVQALLFRVESFGEEGSSPAYNYNTLRLCLELLHSALTVANEGDDLNDSAATFKNVANGHSVLRHEEEAQMSWLPKKVMPSADEIQQSDWGSMESSCSFDEHEEDGLDDDAIVRIMASQAHLASSLPMDGCIFPEFRTGVYDYADKRHSISMF